MPLSFNCPACGHHLEAPDAAAGRRGNCKFCRAQIVAPIFAGGPASLVDAAVPAKTPAATIPSMEPPSVAPDPMGAGIGAGPYAGANGSSSAGSSSNGFTPPGFTPPGYDSSAGPNLLPDDLMANPSVAKAFITTGRPAVSDFWKRVLGFGIDMLIITGLQFALASIMLSGMKVETTDVLLATRAQMGATLQFTLTMFAAKILYGAILEGSPLQATIGKYILGMKVCTPETGEPISFLNALWRNFAKWFTVAACSFAPFISFFPYAIFAYAVRDDMTQTLHDMCAGTVVADRSW